MMCAGRVRAGCAVSLRLGGCEDLAAVPSIGRAVRVEPRVAPEADATRSLYERYANQIFRYCVHQLGSREEAEDAVQSTFLNAFRGLRRGVVPELESAWLFKIAHNVCLSRQRSAWRRGKIESPADFELVEELLPAPSRRTDELIGLEDVLAQMPETQRRAILLREWQGLSYREIADELELSQGAVETLIFRARRSLAAGLEQPDETRGRKRFARAFDWGNLVAAAKSLFVGGSVAAKVAATVAVVGATTAAVTAPVVLEHHGHSAPPGKAKPAHHPAAPIVHAVAPTPAALKPAAPVHARGTVLHRPVKVAHTHVAPGQLRKAGLANTPTATGATPGAVKQAAHAAKHAAVRAKVPVAKGKASTVTHVSKRKANAKGPAKPATHAPKVATVPALVAPTTPADSAQPPTGNGRGQANGSGRGDG
jgi:RNA polymerase sigma factor (sigma-70 family)